jgi:hypothetical protein
MKCRNCAEEWRDIKGYEGLYQISNLGRVKSLICWCGNKNIKAYRQREKILKTKPKKNGYLVVTLRYQNVIKYKSIHRLVAKAFLPNPNNYPVVNHIDGNKTNNNINNLEWCSYSHNTKEAIRIGLMPKPNTVLKRWTGKFGKEHNRSRHIYQIHKKTNQIVAEYYGVPEIVRKTGFHARAVGAVLYHRRKTTGGYIWKFADEY